MAKRRRKIKRSPPPWKSAVGFSMGIHAVIILCIVGVGWRYLHQEKPGLPILIHEVIVGDGEGAASLLPRGEGGRRPDEGEVQVRTPSPRPSPPPKADWRKGEGDSTLASDNAGDTHVGTGNGTGAARGTGNGSGTGTGGAGNPTLAEIRRRIEAAKRYPAQARAMHQEGRVGLRFRIQPNGQIAEVHITQSSGVPALDDAAMQAVTRSAPLPYYSAAIEFPIAFHLR